jgi:hypothetical protein
MCLVVVFAASVIAFNARAFDFFGLWGSDETPPPVSRTAISYAVTIEVEGGDSALKNAVTDTSSLYKLRKDPPPDGDALARPETQNAQRRLGPFWRTQSHDHQRHETSWRLTPVPPAPTTPRLVSPLVTPAPQTARNARAVSRESSA